MTKHSPELQNPIQSSPLHRIMLRWSRPNSNSTVKTKTSSRFIYDYHYYHPADPPMHPKIPIPKR